MMRRIFSIVLATILTVILSFALLLAACDGQGSGEGDAAGTGVPSTTATDTAVTVTDMTGRTVMLDKPAEKVIVLTASACEIVYAIDAGSTVVGRGEYCDWPAEVLAVPALQSGTETNIEQIIALSPDLVLMATMDQTLEQIQQIENTGIAVYVSNANDIAGTYESILQIGTLMGKDSEAQAVVDNMKATFDELSSQKVTGTVYFEVSPLEYGLWTAGNNTFMNEIAGLIGLENIFADVEGWAEISEEQVLERNPDYIVTIAMYFGEGPTPEAEIAARPSWQSITAVQNGNILNLANNELSRPGPRLADGAQELYDFVKGS
ncbi:MAG: ABC transporter substrate-binding protein [Coriobacteriales bacterium]|jgi:iron complex transport system substrate-binding protein|nr:ABC transporter substrate-binding protein [Coriobacteriales bacterium]